MPLRDRYGEPLDDADQQPVDVAAHIDRIRRTLGLEPDRREAPLPADQEDQR